ncbi:MAG TPA: UDP-2,3-diacylglucosamine diphosphatase [Methylophilaceae bacterium]|nr:UDP-2,3-diacylglucosamine diphosphatase [Methylophilaceae bacterium]
MASNAGTDIPHSLFISDLHLCSSRPAISRLFLNFLQEIAGKTDALYILGDLFEYWAGDDDLADPHHSEIITALSRLKPLGTQVFLMHGNRDFLLGDGFAAAANIILLPDPTLLTLHGRRVLLTHGDTLCTDDVAYQAFRLQVRDSAWQQQFLAMPLSSRKGQIEALRQRSEQEKSQKAESIMDVNNKAVHALLQQYGYPELLIHGHTHRPARHEIRIEGHECVRWVLGDWYEQGSCLRCDANGCHSLPL